MEYYMKIKLIIFDLDGVLVDAKKIHFDSLNQALSSIDTKYNISWNEHLTMYDGLKTNQKLNLLTEKKGLPVDLHKTIWNKKQNLTLKMLKELKINEPLVKTISKLSELGYLIACASNSIRKSVITMLSKSGIIEYFDLIMSNEDVLMSKPHPQIYWECMSKLKVLPNETLIIEDSPTGLMAAHTSGAYVMRVKNSDEVTFNNIRDYLNPFDNVTPKWVNKKMNILIPMAGAGSRFANAGYTFPKPLIDVNNKPMIQVVVDNLNIDATYIYIVQKNHRVKYNLDTLLNLITPNCKIVEVDGITEGAACTTLLAKDLINNDDFLLIANSDQYVEWNSNEFMYNMESSETDGSILVFKSNHPKWSFVKLDGNNLITEVAEKNPISDNATVGIYFWKKGSDYVKYSEQMIEKDIRTNNEFYVCPVYNEAINDGKTIKPYYVEKMWGIGTPEDLRFFLEKVKI
jgi:HAD superfamily hydrolase (TIGR01509 family)